MAALHVPARARALGRARRRAEPGVHGLHLARAADARRGARRAARGRRARRRQGDAARQARGRAAQGRRGDGRATRGGRARTCRRRRTSWSGIRVDGAFLYLEPGDVAALIAEASAGSGSHAERRERFRMLAARRLYEQYGRKLDDLAFRSFDELERALRTFLGRLVDRTWPRAEAGAARAPRARGGEARRPRLERGGPAAASTRRARCSKGRREQHGHVIVDEAQDLTPMQLRMLARRTTGAMTILGDIAQAAGPVEYHRWEDLLPHLADGRDVSVAELRLAYRVPREVMELALPLLPLIAPDVAPPIAYREGDEPPRFVQVARARARRDCRARGVDRSGARGPCGAHRAGEAPGGAAGARPTPRSTSWRRRSRR